MPDVFHEIVGDKGWARLDAESNTIELGLRGKAGIGRESYSYDRDEMFVDEHNAFLDAIDGKRRPESPAINAAKSVRIMDAALRSWKQGAPTKIAD